MGSRGQFTRNSVAHHHPWTTSTFDEMATEGEAQSISRYTFEGPSSRPTKVQPDPDLQCWPVCKRRCKGRRRVLHRRHMCKQNQGKVPMHVSEAQVRVSRLQATLDLLGTRISQGISRDCQAAMSRAARGRTSGFLFKVRGACPRTHRATEENCRGSTATLTKCESQLAAGLQDLEWLRAEVRACPALPASHTKPQSCGICDEKWSS